MKQEQRRKTQTRTDDAYKKLSQIFWHFCAKNCDQKVTKFSSKKNFPVGKKKKKSPPVGQTLGSSHFGETPLSFGGGGLYCRPSLSQTVTSNASKSYWYFVMQGFQPLEHWTIKEGRMRKRIYLEIHDCNSAIINLPSPNETPTRTRPKPANCSECWGNSLFFLV